MRYDPTTALDMITPKRKDRCPCGSGKKYKRCCIVIPKYVYLDESGNTGINHFDPHQPFFFQGCLVANSDLDISAASEIQAISAKVGASELHGNELGIGRLAVIATDLAAFLRKHRLQFMFTVFEKPHFLALMIFHLIYDPGLNPAVNTLAFTTKIGRMVLSLNFSTLVDERERRDFWKATQTDDEELFISVMKALQTKLDASGHDPRTKELIGDALAYAIQKPKDIFASMTFKKQVAPNIAAFAMTINGINNVFRGMKVEIQKVVHDTQREFTKELKAHFNSWSTIARADGPRSLITDVSTVEVIKAKELELVDSKISVGLQVIDTALWIFKRWSLGHDISGIEPLFEAIAENSWFDGVTLRTHQNAVRSYDAMLPKLTPKQMAETKEQIALLDRRRWSQNGNTQGKS